MIQFGTQYERSPNPRSDDLARDLQHIARE